MVPKIIHQIVGPKVNESIQMCLDSWKCLAGSGFEVRIWGDESLEEFLRENYPFALAAFLDARNHAEAADIARYLFVYHYGGIYVDWDIELLIPMKFNALLESHPNGYLIIDPKNGTLASEHFCSMAGDPYLLCLSKDIIEMYNSGERSSLTTVYYSGPFRMRDSLKVHNNTNMDILNVKDVFAFDYEEIRNSNTDIVTTPMIHYWAHSWLASDIVD